MWDTRYSNPNYVYGTAPNGYLKQYAHRIPKGRFCRLPKGRGKCRLQSSKRKGARQRCKTGAHLTTEEG